MMTSTETIKWDMGHRIPNSKSGCDSPHGHAYSLEVTVEGTPLDLSGVRKTMAKEIQKKLDLGFMYYKKDECLATFFNARNFKSIRVDFIPAPDKIVKWCYDRLKRKFPKGAKIRLLKLFESPHNWAFHQPR